MFADRVFETTTTTGTGTYTVLGAQGGYEGFADAFSNGAIVGYHCRNSDGSIWESGFGTLNTSAGTITRTLLESSTGSLINWGAGTKNIYSWPLSAVLSSMARGNDGTARPGWLSLGFWTDTANSLWKYFNGSTDIPLLPTTLATQGDVLYYGASGVPARLGAGTARQFMRTGGAAANPAWGWPGFSPGPSSELTIASGAVTVTGAHHSLDTQSNAATDDLDTITATALAEGECVVLKAENAARVVTVKNGTGNVILLGGDYALDDANKRLVLQKVGSDLVEIARTKPQKTYAPVATTSGATFSFTAIPPGITRMTLAFVGVSLNGTDDIIIELGDSGGIETSGYLGGGSTIPNGSSPTTGNYTAGFGVRTASGDNSLLHGAIEFTLVNPSTNTWAAQGVLSHSNSAISVVVSGSKSLSGVLTQLRGSTEGANNFDAGTVRLICWS